MSSPEGDVLLNLVGGDVEWENEDKTPLLKDFADALDVEGKRIAWEHDDHAREAWIDCEEQCLCLATTLFMFVVYAVFGVCIFYLFYFLGTLLHIIYNELHL